jgi:hypothetical protein
MGSVVLAFLLTWVITGEVPASESIETIRAAADAGDAEAQRELGVSL